MVKKKVKRRTRAKVSRSRVSKSRGVGNISSKLNMVGRRLVFFLIFFVLFLVFNSAVSNSLWSDFFGLGTLIFGFISLALFVVLLVLWFMKLMKK